MFSTCIKTQTKTTLGASPLFFALNQLDSSSVCLWKCAKGCYNSDSGLIQMHRRQHSLSLVSSNASLHLQLLTRPVLSPSILFKWQLTEWHTIRASCSSSASIPTSRTPSCTMSAPIHASRGFPPTADNAKSTSFYQSVMHPLSIVLSLSPRSHNKHKESFSSLISCIPLEIYPVSCVSGSNGLQSFFLMSQQWILFISF